MSKKEPFVIQRLVGDPRRWQTIEGVSYDQAQYAYPVAYQLWLDSAVLVSSKGVRRSYTCTQHRVIRNGATRAANVLPATREVLDLREAMKY